MNIFEKIYHQCFMNYAAQIAEKEIAFFSVFGKKNSKKCSCPKAKVNFHVTKS